MPLIAFLMCSLVACHLTDSGMKQAMRSYMYYQDIDDSSESLSQKSMLALCNALIVIGFIACLTFVIVLMYKFNCMQLFLGYCIFYSTSLLGMAGAKILVLVLCNKWHWVVDILSLSLAMYNFAVVGVLSIFYRTGIPLRIEQAYLVCTSVIVAWQLAQLPEWSVWMILLLLAFWDLFAVMTPIGPLRCLVDLIQEKGTPLPGLLFQADVTDAHVATQPNESVMDRSLASKDGQQAAQQTKIKTRQAEEMLLETLLVTAKQQQASSTAAVTPAPSPSLEQGNELYTFHQRVKGYLYHHDSIFQHRSYELSQLYVPRQREFWQMVTRVYVSHNKTEEADKEDKTIKLGLGDFIFYSVLVARAATHGMPTFLACFVSILVVSLCIQQVICCLNLTTALLLNAGSGHDDPPFGAIRRAACAADLDFSVNPRVPFDLGVHHAICGSPHQLRAMVTARG